MNKIDFPASAKAYLRKQLFFLFATAAVVASFAAAGLIIRLILP